MDNETITVTDAESFPDVFDPEAIKVTDAVTVTPLINVAAPVADYSAGSLGFGNVAAGQIGVQALTVSDIGKAPLMLSSAVISQSAAFTISQIACSNGATSFPTTLPVGGACTLMISYMAPTGAAPSATLTFTDNAALSNVASAQSGASYTQSMGLNGTGSSTSAPPPPPAVIPVVDNETITVTDVVTVISVQVAPAITSLSSTTFTVGLAGTVTVTATGLPAPTIIEVGALPTGVTFNAATGVLGGTPTAGTAGTYNITFTASNGVLPNAVQNFVLTVHLPVVASLVLNPASVPGGATNSIGRVTLNAPAVGTAAQRTVTLTSDNTAVATVPATVTVATGATSANFTVTSHVVESTTTANIAAALNGGAQSAVLTVTPLPQVASLTLNPTSVPGGATISIGRVTLNAPAVGTAAQRTVTLTSDNTAVATVPATVTVATGATSANFTVTSHVVESTTTANIAAALNGGAQSAVLTVTPLPQVASLTLNPTSVPGGATISIGRVTFNAPAVGTVAQRTVTLSSGNTAAATVPATVTVAAGATAANFRVTSLTVVATTTANISATLNGGTQSAVHAVTPQAGVLSVAFNPSIVLGGSANSTATVTLNASAAGTAAQRTVALSSNNTAAATVPASVIVATGATTATFTVTSHVVNAAASPIIAATLNGSATATLIVNPLLVTALVLNPIGVRGGSANSTATITLNCSAAGTVTQRTVTLSSTITAAATVPASVVVPAGAISTSFTVTSHVVGTLATPSISASIHGSTQSAVLTVTP